MLVDHNANLAELLLHFLGDFLHQARGFAQHVGLLANRYRLVAELARVLECRLADASRRRTRDDAYRDGQIFASHVLERLELRVRAQRVAHRGGRIAPLHPGIESFGVLAEDDDIDLRLVEAAGWLFANEVQGIAGKRKARPHADIEIELLPHGHDGAEILIALALQRWAQFELQLPSWASK